MQIVKKTVELGGKIYDLVISEVETKEPETPKEKKKPALERYVFENVTMKAKWVNPPKGLIVHFHAGHRDSRNNSLSTLELGRKNGYKYICLEEDGVLHFPANDKTDSGIPSFYGHSYHCGTFHHKDHVGVEVICSGKLSFISGMFKTWFKKVIPVKEVRKVKAVDNIVAGYYQAFTSEQEKALVDLCLYLDATYDSFSLDRVLGHDEVAPGRKNDPGGSLSKPMPKFRLFLKREKIKRGL